MYQGGYTRVGNTGGYNGWVIPGIQPCQGPLPQGPPDSEAGPVEPAGLGVGGQEGRPRGPVRASAQPPTPPLPAVGPGRSPAGPSLGRGLGSSGKRARFRYIS